MFSELLSTGNSGVFFEYSHARNLQIFVEAELEMEALIEDGDEHMDRDGDRFK